MPQNGPGKPKQPADDGFSDTAGDVPVDDAATSEKPASWLESGESSGMFADSAAAPDAPGYEVRSVEGSTDGEEVAMQDRARDASADAYADAYEQATSEPDTGVEPPVLAEAAEAPDPYEFKDDGGTEASSWVDSEPVRSWTPEDDFAPSPELLSPDAPLGPSTTAAPSPAKSAPAPRPGPTPPSKSPPRPPAPPVKSGPVRPPSGAQRPGPRTSGPPRPASGVQPRPATGSGPVKPPAARPPGATPGPPPTRPDSGATPRPGSKKSGGLDLDNLFKRAKDIKKDDGKS